MIKSLFNILKKSTVTSGAIILVISSFVSRILGLVRDRLFASTFGAGDDLDAYYAAFRIPDFIFNLLILGALSSAFVPVFVNYLSRGKKEEAWHITNSLLNILLLVSIVICGLFFLFADRLIFLIAPGFDQGKKELTVLLTRIMLVTPIFFGLSSIASCILNSFKSFFLYAAAPIIYNLGIIFGAIFFVPRFKVLGLSIGVALGAFLHAAIQLPKVFSLGFRWRFTLDFLHDGVKKIGKLMLPRSFGLAFNQVNLWVITVIASTIASGSVAIFNLANNLQSFPIGIFGISFAVASFPYLAEAVSKNDVNLFKLHFSKTFSKILFFVVPISVLMLLERAQIVRLILGSGKFDWEDTILTADSLGFFSLSIFAQALIPLLARSFYSFSDTKTPVLISLAVIVLNILGSLWFAKYFGILGIVFVFSISSFINMILLLIILRMRVGDLGDFKIFRDGFKVMIASVLAAFAAYGALYLMAFLVDMRTFLGVFLQAAVAALCGILVYFIFSVLLRHEEAASLIQTIKNIRRNNN
jgi:putative peptidoglycan lipid II flippase